MGTGINKYTDCIFSIGSITVVEDLWNEAGWVVGGERCHSLAPVTLGRILFFNKSKDPRDNIEVKAVIKSKVDGNQGQEGEDEEEEGGGI